MILWYKNCNLPLQFVNLTCISLPRVYFYRNLENCHLKSLILKDYCDWTCKICFLVCHSHLKYQKRKNLDNFKTLIATLPIHLKSIDKYSKQNDVSDYQLRCVHSEINSALNLHELIFFLKNCFNNICLSEGFAD